MTWDEVPPQKSKNNDGNYSHIHVLTINQKVAILIILFFNWYDRDVS